MNDRRNGFQRGQSRQHQGCPRNTRRAILKIAVCEHGKFGAAGYKDTAVEDLLDQCNRDGSHLYVVHDVVIDIPVPKRPRWETLPAKLVGSTEEFED